MWPEIRYRSVSCAAPCWTESVMYFHEYESGWASFLASSAIRICASFSKGTTLPPLFYALVSWGAVRPLIHCNAHSRACLDMVEDSVPHRHSLSNPEDHVLKNVASRGAFDAVIRDPSRHLGDYICRGGMSCSELRVCPVSCRKVVSFV